jgi:uncharacterized protein (TIGR02996 family)
MLTLDQRMQRGFLSAIIAEPELNELRLVYADWLEDRGHPLSEMIRVQVKLAEFGPLYLPEQIAVNSELYRRTTALYQELWAERQGIFPNSTGFTDDCPEWSFGIDRGVVHLYLYRLPPDDPLPIPPQSWLDRFGWYILHVEKRLPKDQRGGNFCFSVNSIAELLDSTIMDRCLGLELSSTAIDSGIIQELMKSPRIAGILSLNLGHTALGISGARALSESPHLQDLLDLDLSETDLGDEGVSVLAASRAFPRLRFLKLWNVHAGPAGLTELAKASQVGEVSELHVGTNAFDVNSAKAWASSVAFPNLKSLHLDGAQLEADVVRELAHGPLLANLNKLVLDHCNMDDAAACELATATGLDRLAKLVVSHNPFTDVGAEAILRSPVLKKMEFDWLGNNLGAGTVRALAETGRFRSGKLSLWNCGVCDEDIEPLVTSPEAANLAEVQLGYARITDSGATRLAESRYLKNVRNLCLPRNQITAKGVKALLTPGAFPRLEYLSLDYNPLGDEGAPIFAQWLRRRGFDKLNFHDSGLTDAGVVRLIQSGCLTGLRSLSLSSNPIGDAAVIALAECPNLAELEYLSVANCGTTDAAAQALAASPCLPKTMQLEINVSSISQASLAALRKMFPQNRLWL